MIHAFIFWRDIDGQVLSVVSGHEIHVPFELEDEEAHSVRQEVGSVHLSIDILNFLHK